MKEHRATMTLIEQLIGRRSKRPLPKWTDEDGVVELVSEIVSREHARSRRFIEMNVADGDEIDRFKAAEEVAVAAARQGDPAVLANLLRSENRDWLGRDAIELAIEFMTGRRILGTGNPKGKRGPGKKTPEQRRAMNPIHDAASDALLIQYYLRHLYPEQSADEVRDRAVEFMAERAGVDPETLHNHLARSRKDRRRLG